MKIDLAVRDFNRFPDGVKIISQRPLFTPLNAQQTWKGNCRNQESQLLQMDIVESVEIRPASGADVDSLGEFLRPFIERKQVLPRTKEDLALLIENGYVAMTGPQIAGFAAVVIYSQKLAEIQCLSVAPHLQGKGVGRRLVNACVDLAKSRGVIELMAITSSENIFRSCGFDYSLPEQKRAMFIQTGDIKYPQSED